jgi:hypothetical protein
MPVARRVTKPAVETITLGKARDAWLASIQPGCLPKTYTIKKTAIEALVSFLGKRPNSTGHPVRPGSVVSVHARRQATPTLTNKQFTRRQAEGFEWVISATTPKATTRPRPYHHPPEKRARKKAA